MADFCAPGGLKSRGPLRRCKLVDSNMNNVPVEYGWFHCWLGDAHGWERSAWVEVKDPDGYGKMVIWRVSDSARYQFRFSDNPASEGDSWRQLR